jgi:hypothetical protein
MALHHHWRESYVAETGKSMNTGKFGGFLSGLLAINRHYTQNPVNERYRLLQQQSNLRFAKVQCAVVQGNTARI